ncbi:purine-nucleoside phosphorylase [Silvanigrella aquatica]|uniref:Purine nucleoside phosphorylase n=1 Tax=Silvanigrella aquatica TaxID=1915309 RepID=A0A1L4D1R3_9BACT|nr:purine-nucleoside phosphorylase [Silvanigrella aquatica]APJ04137.1 purine-nucleoside phosphorylase [Silvanigrella aquatica]
MKENKYSQRVNQSVAFLKQWHQSVPEIAIVLGSGLSEAIPGISEMKSVNYSDIPGFKGSTVPGHNGSLRVGSISASLPNGTNKTREFAFLQGRNHAYEGNDAGEVVHNIRSLITWGVKGIILTNAAGCLNTEWELGKMMILTDHINATGMSPLNAEYGESFGARFVDLSDAYNLEWRKHFQETAQALNQTIYSGVYYGVLGSHYETPSEIRMMKTVGADAVGMSTVLETIAARQMKAKVVGISCFTNYGAGLKKEILDHSDVMNMSSRFSHDMANVILKTAVTLEV